MFTVGSVHTIEVITFDRYHCYSIEGGGTSINFCCVTYVSAQVIRHMSWNTQRDEARAAGTRRTITGIPAYLVFPKSFLSLNQTLAVQS